MPEALGIAFRDLANAEGDGWRLTGSARPLDLWGLPDPPSVLGETLELPKDP
jgi:hypothetical protein